MRFRSAPPHRSSYRFGTKQQTQLDLHVSLPTRIEQRYIVNEQLAVELRWFVREHLRLDDHCHGKEDLSYPVNDLYLDSDDLQLHWSTINGDENQAKLRLRSYGDDASTRVFLELKQTLGGLLTKERVAIHRAAIKGLWSERNPDPSWLISRVRKSTLTFERLCKILKGLNARPKLHLTYRREVYRTANASVNFDRHVGAEPASSDEAASDLPQPTLVWDKDVIVEFKYTEHRPAFYTEIERHFGLRSVEVEKYVDAVALLGESRLRI